MLNEDISVNVIVLHSTNAETIDTVQCHFVVAQDIGKRCIERLGQRGVKVLKLVMSRLLN